MKTKKYLYAGILALVGILTVWTALDRSQGELFQGRFFGDSIQQSQNTLAIVIETPADNNNQFSYKHPIMFRANVKSPSPIPLAKAQNLTFTWESDQQGILGHDMEFEHKLSRGNHLITCTVTDNLGNKGSAQRQINITNTPPKVTILTPSAGTTAKYGQPLILKADVYDKEEHVIPDVYIKWKSHLDGEIGKGKTLTVEHLSTGDHKITVIAKDSEGATDKDEINITVL